MNEASVDVDLSSQLVMLCAATRPTRRPDLQIRRHLLLAIVVAALAAAACSPTQPTPKLTASAEPTVTASAEPTPESSAVALEPTIDCHTSAWTPPPNIGPITLTCENAVAAAKAVLGPDPSVTSIEFRFGQWCPPDRPCLAIAVLNGGYVIFHRKTGADLVVIVRADKNGKVTAANPVLIVDRGASQSDHPG
jgi:hypothetical protein